MAVNALKPRRLLVYQTRRSARRGEKYIAVCEFPLHVRRGVLGRHPNLSEDDLNLVLTGLRDWFICCAWRGRQQLGMPSRAVDEAWQEFTLDTPSYAEFCRLAFRKYLPRASTVLKVDPLVECEDGLLETVRAWDRSDAGSNREAVLWDLDLRIGISSRLAVDRSELRVARSRSPYPLATGWVGNWDGMYVGSGDSGSGYSEGGGDGGDGGS